MPENYTAEELKIGANYEVWKHLKMFTHLPDKDLERRINREGNHHFLKEFAFFNPQTLEERRWFYQHSTAYLFANAVHKPWKLLLDEVKDKKVFDFGAGVGVDSIPLALENGCDVTCSELNILQETFLKLRTQVLTIPHWVRPSLVPLGFYDVIIARDILEHLPDYSGWCMLLASHLNTGGLIYENTPFQKPELPEDVHVHERVPLKEAMKQAGMYPVDRPHVWVKG